MGDYLRYFRPMDWVYYIGLSLLGYFFAAKSPITNEYFATMVVLSTFSLSFAYSTNQYFDSRRKYPKKYLFASLFLLAAAIMLAYSISFLVLFLTLLGGSLVILYSHPFITFKDRKYFAMIINPLSFVILFLIGYSSYAAPGIEAILFSILVFMLMAAGQLLHEMDHRTEDINSMSMTVAVKVGEKKSIYFVKSILIFVLVWSFIINYFLEDITMVILTSIFSILSVFIVNRNLDIHKKRILIRYLGILYGIFLIFNFVL